MFYKLKMEYVDEVLSNFLTHSEMVLALGLDATKLGRRIDISLTTCSVNLYASTCQTVICSFVHPSTRLLLRDLAILLDARPLAVGVLLLPVALAPLRVALHRAEHLRHRLGFCQGRRLPDLCRLPVVARRALL